MNKMMKGVIHVTGEHDVGKTTFALECGALPRRTCFFDDDIKGRVTVQEIEADGTEWGIYFDLVSRGRGKKLLEFHRECLDLIESIKPGQFDVIVWDTWSRFASTCRHYVFTNPNEFRRPGVMSKGGGWSDKGSIKGAEMNKEGVLYEAAIIGQLAQLAPTVVLITHLKAHYFGNKRTGKEVPDSSKALGRVPKMRIWLRQNPDGRPVPIGLFLKRFDRKTVTENGLRTTCIVPRKIVPAEDDQSLWDTIWRYWEDPVGTRKPTPEETPNEFELAILDGTLTADQKRTLNLVLRASVAEGEGETWTPPVPVSSNESKTAKAKALIAKGGMTKLAIAKETGLSVAEVARL